MNSALRTLCVQSAMMIMIMASPCCECGTLFKPRPPRLLDGSLRCYQCSSYDQEDAESRFVCNVSNWKRVSVSQKWAVIMQCPRRKSAFCRLVLNPETGQTERGCASPKYADGQLAHVGCFDSDTTTRACLCNTNLCNRAAADGLSSTGFVVATAVGLTLLTL